MAVYIVNGEMAQPDSPKEQLHEYHAEIEGMVDANVVGLTGRGSKIKRIMLSEQSDISGIEDWLNASLSLDDE